MSEEITQLNIGGNRIGIIGLSNVIEEVKPLKLENDAELQRVLLGKVKQQNYVPDTRIEEYSQALLREYKKSLGLKVEEQPLSKTSIRILGPGCSACEKMEQDIKSILTELNIGADVQHIRDVKQIAEYGMVRTPTLVINKEIVLNGRSLPKSQLRNLIEQKLT